MGNDAVQRLHELWAEISDIGTAASLLAWDQETHMPAAGAVGRAPVMATIAGLTHSRLTSPELAEVIEAVEESAGDDPVLLAQAREARRHHERAVKVPEALARAIAETSSRALMSWQQARAEDDFALFRDDLAEIIRLTVERAEALADGGNPYDALLDEYEPGTSENSVAALFSDLTPELSDLVKAVAESGVDVDESPAYGEFPERAQRDLGIAVATRMGFDFDAGRLDRSAHPFCTSMNPRDVRLTWRWDENDFRPALLGVMHEAGHGLYEQGLPGEWHRTPIGGSVSLGVHESQSRLWENLVGRSRAFWRWAIEPFRLVFPDHPEFAVEDIWRALHVVEPSLIRVEADEVTYNLHVAVRFEIERRLIRGDLDVDDLPGVWDDTYDDLLGVRASSAAEGVLQDIHWSMGAFGYFPTYTIGNLVASQLYDAASAEAGPFDDAFENGDLSGLLAWLRSRVHAHGSRWLPDELVDRASARPLTSASFLSHVRRICEDNYGVI
ncbi:MAG: carboxypeptidase M32 [Actinobacteria bacterium ATB1]|nr:carboxypeptidase M32 [Actinobacteria bacterium ATB1]